MKFLDLSKLGRNKCSFYFALEQYLLDKNDDEVFFFWDIYPSVIIGRHQLIANEVNEEFINSKGIELFRRVSGGGCVFADEGDFMFTFITNNTNVNDTFKIYLNKFCDALRKININATFTGRNDLLIDGKKFSGNAFFVKGNRSVLHGTFMYDVNIENLVRAITPSKEKLISKGVESVRQRVVNLKEHTDLTMSEIKEALKSFICDEVIYLSEDEVNLIREKEKDYLTHEWIRGNNPPYSLVKEKRFPNGLVNLRLDITKNRIKNISFGGDFMWLKDINELAKLFIGLEFTIESIDRVLKEVKVEEYVMGITNNDLLSLLFD